MTAPIISAANGPTKGMAPNRPFQIMAAISVPFVLIFSSLRATQCIQQNLRDKLDDAGYSGGSPQSLNRPLNLVWDRILFRHYSLQKEHAFPTFSEAVMLICRVRHDWFEG